MILVDAGVLIDYLRQKDPKLKKHFGKLPVAICGITRSEILAGARGPKDRNKLLGFLSTFRYIRTLETNWDAAGDNAALLRTQGITVPLQDVFVATLGIENNLEVWARDPHFPMMQTALKNLKLFQEPP